MNDETTVLDDDLPPAPVGVVGKLARRGHIPLGYYKDPEKTAATFPVVDGVRWSVPGDHARIEDDGTITLLGRGSVSINTGGEKVYPEEVEARAEVAPRRVRRGRRRRARRALGRARRRRRAEPRPARDRHARRARRARRARTSPGTRCRATSCFVDTIVRSPSGKPDYRWAKQTAIASSCPTTRALRPHRDP